MKLKLKLVTLAILALVSVSKANADDFGATYDRDNEYAQSARDLGVDVYLATSAVPYLVTGASYTTQPSTYLVFGVFTSTGPQGLDMSISPTFVELRATDTANTTSELLVPGVAFSTQTRNTLVIYDPPLVAGNGLSINITTIPVGVMAAVFYRRIQPGQDDDLWIPVDGQVGRKAHDSTLYGVLPSSSAVGGATAENGRSASAFDYTTTEKVIANSTVSSEGDPQHFYGWVASSGVRTNYMTLQATNTTVGSLNNFLPPVFYRTLSQETFDNAFLQASFQFPWPLNAPNGLGVQLSSANDRLRILRRPKRRMR